MNKPAHPMDHENPAPSLQGSCHCGAVRLTLPAAPEKATSCNCSLCRRSGGIWAYYEFGTVLESVVIRRFDGADTWTFLEGEA